MGRKSKYSKQFKEDTVNLIIKEGYAIREAGRNLGIPEATLRLWKTEIEKENNPEYQEEKSDREEILRLKGE